MNIKKTLIGVLKNPYKIVTYFNPYGFMKFLPDDIYLKLMFRGRIGKKLNLKNPKTFNEKLQWLKLNDRNPLYPRLVDKFEVRKFISNTIGDEYLVPLLGVYENFDEINFDQLPNRFVLKCTHDSGGLVLCKNKKKLNKDYAKAKITESLMKNFFYYAREWPYKGVVPKIICEEYLEDITTKELRDYKFMCFNGKVKCSFVCLNRNSNSGLNVDFYDIDWNPMPFERFYKNSGTKISKPKNYNKMIELAEKLSKNFPFVRVDFYEINGQIYFGELTFHPGSGFEEFSPEIYDEILGSWIDLTK